MRQVSLKNGYVYHIFNKSIAGYEILQSNKDYWRFTQTLYHYNNSAPKLKLADFVKIKKTKPAVSLLKPRKNQIIKFISYHLMPTHFHIQAKVLNDKYTYHYLNTIANSYTRYFNTKYNRKGPLWQSPYRAKLVTTEEQSLHLSRYIHLNSTTARLVEKPEDWEFSSYREYITDESILKDIMTEITIKSPKQYKKFVENQIDYQRRLKVIEKILLK